jgi:hypothetical protein
MFFDADKYDKFVDTHQALKGPVISIYLIGKTCLHRTFEVYAYLDAGK